jgi:hypothetical protein
MKGIILSITLLSSSLMAMQVPSAEAMQGFLKACESPVVTVEKSLKDKALGIAQASYTSAKPYADKGVTMAKDFYKHPTDSLKTVGERISSFDQTHPGLIVKSAACILGAYIVYKAMRWLYGKLPAKKIETVRPSACAPRKPTEQNPKLKAFQDTLKK